MIYCYFGAIIDLQEIPCNAEIIRDLQIMLLMLNKFKVNSHLPKNCFICFNEIPLKVVKNAFYFILETLRTQDFQICV